MQMRHQARFSCNRLEQVFINLDAIDRTDPQAWQVRHQFQDAHYQIAQFGRCRQVGPPTGQVDPCQNNFVVPGIDQPFDLIDNNPRRRWMVQRAMAEPAVPQVNFPYRELFSYRRPGRL